MLPKDCRIRLTRDFERIFNYRRSVSGRFVRLTMAPPANPEQRTSRFAVVTSTKVSKKAVIRNRLRRRVRADISKILPLIKEPLDIIVICQPSAVGSSAIDFRNDLYALIAKVYRVRL